MYIPFDQIDNAARIWVFQSTRPFSHAEMTRIEGLLKDFTKQWTSHQHELESSYKIEEGRFILLAVNEAVNDASGCSIDKSVHIIKTLEQELSLNLMDKTLVSFWIDGEIRSFKLSNLKDEISKGTVHENTLVFNTLISNKKEYLEHFKIPASQTWLKRYFVKSAI